MKSPVSLCMITKNDPLIFDCIKSAKDYVAEIIVVDTGSTKEYQDQVKSLVDILEIFTDCCDPQTGLMDNFSQARQKSFSLSKQPYQMWADSDDVLEGLENLPRLLSYAESIKHQFDAIAFMFPYEYAFDHNNQCILRHYRERLISNKNHFVWRNPVHEVLCKSPDTANVNFISDDSIIWKHKRQFSPKPAEPGRNLRILRKYLEGEGKDDARQYYYIGLEYANNGFPEEAIQSLTKYIDMSGWDDERNMACLKLVDIYQAKNQLQEGLKWAFKAIEICESWAEGYFALGRMFYLLAQQGGPNQLRYWQRCSHFIKLGLSMPPTKTLLFVNPLEREHEIHKYLNVALNSTGDVRGALDSCNTGLKRKDDPMLAGNKKLYEKFLINQQIFGALEQLKTSEYIKPEAADLISNIINDKVSVAELLKPRVEVNTLEFTPCGAPCWLSSTKQTLLPVIEKTADTKLDIILYTGPGVEEWTPATVEQTGIGGSELMALEMAKRLSKLGHKVRLYNSCGANEGNYEGVEYIRFEKYQNLNCDVLIVSRRAEMVDDKFNITAKLKLLWVHDVFAINANNRLLLKYDRVLALSEWHKQNLVSHHNIHPEQVIKTRNGINVSRFDKNIKRNRFKCVNSSSPDRSWPILLEVWPRIKAQVPQAELHLFYGFRNWEYMAQSDRGQQDLITFLKNRIIEMSAMGVVYHDRVSQDKIAEEFMSAGAWIFSTHFVETSCISAMEAQAAGLRMISSNIGALKETVADRGILIDGEWTSKEYKDKFVQHVVSALRFENDDDRKLLQEYAKANFDLDILANEWEKMFSDLIELKKINPIVPYFPTTPYR